MESTDTGYKEWIFRHLAIRALSIQRVGGGVIFDPQLGTFRQTDLSISAAYWSDETVNNNSISTSS